MSHHSSLTTVMCALIVTVSLIGCGGGSRSTGSAASGSDCGLPLGPPSADAPATKTIALLVDRSRSSSSDKRREQLATDARWVTEQAIATKATMTVGYFDASSTTIEFDDCLDNRQLIPAGNNELVRDRNVAGLTDAITTRITSSMGRSDAAGSDPVAALAAAIERLRTATATTRTVVLLTDFIPTEGCAAITQLNPDPALITPIVERCQSVGQIKSDTGAGITLHVIGVGRTEPPITTDAERWLSNLATTLCQTTGAASCDANPNRPATL